MNESIAVIQNNENPSLCVGCGLCCKRSAGTVFPQQFDKIDESVITNLIKNGYCFDYWEGNPTDNAQHNDKTAYYIRPQHKRYEGKIVDGGWGGECVFYSEDTGCSKEFKDRPLQCQALVPKTNRECSLGKGLSKKDGAIAWLPYNDIIQNVIHKLRSNE